MQITRWSPFVDPFNFEKEFEKFFKTLAPTGMVTDGLQAPSMNMYQNENILFVEMAMPGIDSDQITVEIDDNNLLTVKGSTKKKTEVDDKNYYRKEIREGSFFRSVQLPMNVEGDNAKAEYEDGVLLVSVPVLGEKKPRAIQIETKKKSVENKTKKD